MNTMHLITTAPSTTELTSLADTDVEAFFAEAGLTVKVVTHCDTAGCSVCFEELLAQAA